MPKKTRLLNKKHKHHWSHIGDTKFYIEYKCKCGEIQKRVRTPEQEKEWKREIKKLFKPKPEDNVHLIWQSFSKKFEVPNINPIQYKWKGYDLICKIEKWINKFPQVLSIRCDDDSHCGSRLFLIPHECKNKFMGTTVLYVPQCTGEDPIRFFLYPGHNDELIKALVKRQKKAKKYKSMF